MGTSAATHHHVRAAAAKMTRATLTRRRVPDACPPRAQGLRAVKARHGFTRLATLALCGVLLIHLALLLAVLKADWR